MPTICKKIFPAILLLCYCLRPLPLSAGNSENKAPIISAMMQKYHCCPKPLNDQFYQDVLNDFISSLDGEHLYFTESDISQLNDIAAVKSQISGTSNSYLTKAIGLYKQRLNKVDSMINGILQKPFDLSINETINLAEDSISWAHDEKELYNRWYKFLKYETLHRLSEIKYYDSTATFDYILKQQRGELKVVSKSEERIIKRILDNPGGYENYVESLFCNAIATTYDPHSEYLPAVQKENFIGEINGNNFSFGFELDENNKGEVEITRLIPGSPAWKSGQLNQNDVLLQLQWQDKPVVDLAGADVEEIEEMLMSENHKQLTLTVHKANGMRLSVILEKAQIQSDDDFVKSYILNGPKKIGYILLPGFYSQWEASGGSSCANDVAKEVVKLKKANIDALIIDLRNNGGGSMDEALQLAGIFIDEGTLAFSKTGKDRPHALKDPNRGTIYDGPMALLVNSGSASASELLAGTLQDYNRALIIGSPTYGKATFQAVLPTDTTLNLDKATSAQLNKENSDYVKITLGRFYRPTGKSHQFAGVQPDIMLPDPLTDLISRESMLNNALQPDSVKRALVFNPLPPFPVKELELKSAARVAGSKGFKLVEEANKLYVQIRKAKHLEIPLKFESYMALGQKYNSENTTLASALAQDTVRSFTSENHGADIKRMQLGGYEAEQNTRFLKFMMQDIYINEAFLILADYISLKH